MGHIIEPKGVDFLIQSPPLTDKERVEISEFIKKLKLSTLKKDVRKSKSKNKSKV